MQSRWYTPCLFLFLFLSSSSSFSSTNTVGEKIIKRDPLDEIRRAFKLFDDDNTGKISLRNLRRVAKELGENLTDDELRAMIDEFDLDEDGESKYNQHHKAQQLTNTVNEQEFINICTE